MSLRPNRCASRVSLCLVVICAVPLCGCCGRFPSLTNYWFVIENHSQHTVRAQAGPSLSFIQVKPCTVEYGLLKAGTPYGKDFGVDVTTEDGDLLRSYTVVGTKDEAGGLQPIVVAYLPSGGSECPAPLRDVYEIVIVNATAQTLTVRYAGEEWGTWEPGASRTLGPFEESMYDFKIRPLEIVGSDGVSRFPDELVVHTEERNVMGEMPTRTMRVTYRTGRF